ncbi:MAG: hypothetical protein NZ932_00715 [Candidatus Bathyarchaeota archaeon]|nr:hypothetical protein [Candidatus Bathyarchaeota archaeon]
MSKSEDKIPEKPPFKLIIITVRNGIPEFYVEPKNATFRDFEAQWLELKIAFKQENPRIAENLEFWKNYVKEHNCYGLIVEINFDKNCIEYVPIPTKEDYDKIFESEKRG